MEGYPREHAKAREAALQKGVMFSLGVSMLGATNPIFLAPNVKIGGTYYNGQVLGQVVFRPEISQIRDGGLSRFAFWYSAPAPTRKFDGAPGAGPCEIAITPGWYGGEEPFPLYSRVSESEGGVRKWAFQHDNVPAHRRQRALFVPWRMVEWRFPNSTRTYGAGALAFRREDVIKYLKKNTPALLEPCPRKFRPRLT